MDQCYAIGQVKLKVQVVKFPAGGSSRRHETVSDTSIVRHPSEAEQALSHLLQFYARAARSGAGNGGGGGAGAGSSAGGRGGGISGPAAAATVEMAKKHLTSLEAQRKLFLQVPRCSCSGLSVCDLL